MAVCPKCQTELDAEFGMTQCPHCGAFSFVGDDGVARAPEEEAPVSFDPVPFETPEITMEPPAAFDPATADVIDVPTELPPDESALGAFEPPSPVDQGSGGFDAPSAFDTPSGFDAPPSLEAPMESFGMDSFQSVSPMDEPVVETERAPMDFGPASDPLNLNEFANSEVSSGRDGPLLFRVFIGGIDTKEIRESIREVLNDDRFRLDASAVLSRVSKGDLVIDGLSPVKASILVNRIKRLPITIRWEQYAITEANL